MDRWHSVEAEIADFRRYLYGGFPPLEVHAAYDFAWESGAEYKESRKDGRYGHCGVYLIFDGIGTFLYVGKAIWKFDKCIWLHKFPAAKFIDFIPFDTRHALMASK
jgi:hypothetical protein